jgi:hypothetical protein
MEEVAWAWCKYVLRITKSNYSFVFPSLHSSSQEKNAICLLYYMVSPNFRRVLNMNEDGCKCPHEIQ